MSPTPDRRAGTRYEERLRLTADEGLSSDVAGDVTFDGADFSMRDSTGTFNPRTGGVADSGWRRHFLLMGA